MPSTFRGRVGWHKAAWPTMTNTIKIAITITITITITNTITITITITIDITIIIIMIASPRLVGRLLDVPDDVSLYRALGRCLWHWY